MHNTKVITFEVVLLFLVRLDTLLRGVVLPRPACESGGFLTEEVLDM